MNSQPRTPCVMQMLTAYLAQRVQPFDWASANCCHWVAGWVEAAEGRNPMQGLAVTSSALVAQRLVKRLGGDMQAAWTAQLGRQPIAPTLAQRGDVVLFKLAPALQSEAGTGCAMGICTGASAAIALSVGAVIFVPMSSADAAWPLQPLTSSPTP